VPTVAKIKKSMQRPGGVTILAALWLILGGTAAVLALLALFVMVIVTAWAVIDVWTFFYLMNPRVKQAFSSAPL
jgi:hypothetical protein